MQAHRATPQYAEPLYDLPLEQRNIGRFLRLRAEQDGDRVYLTFGTDTYTFAETEKRCRDLARGLAQRGIKEGSRVLFLCPTVQNSFSLGMRVVCWVRR